MPSFSCARHCVVSSAIAHPVFLFLQEDLHATPSHRSCHQAGVGSLLSALTQPLRAETMCSRPVRRTWKALMEARGVIGKEAVDTESTAVAFHSEPWQLRTHTVAPRTPKKHSYLCATKAGMAASLGAPGLLGSGPPVSEPTPPWPSWFSFQSGPSRRDGTVKNGPARVGQMLDSKHASRSLGRGCVASLGDVPVRGARLPRDGTGSDEPSSSAARLSARWSAPANQKFPCGFVL